VQEFVAFASDLVHSGPDTFFARVGKEAMIQTAIVPGAAHFLQKVHPHMQQNVDIAQSSPACSLNTTENAGMRPSSLGTLSEVDVCPLCTQLCAATGALGPLANAPLHIFAPAVGVVFGAIRGLIP
jgi:hypothetical protein